VRIILEVTDGPSQGMKIVVASGQTVQVGRTRWADYAIPDDEAMADVHFAVASAADGCRIRDLSDGRGIAVDGNNVAESVVRNGNQFTAGETNFAVHIEGQSLSVSGSEATADSETTANEPELGLVAVPNTAADVCGHFDLSDEAQVLLDDTMEPQAFLDRLCLEELFPDAVRFLAFWLPKPDCVAWGCRCMRTTLDDPLPGEQELPIQKAEAWAADPTEENRRAAEAAAEATDPSELAGWVARAAFWSGGSLVADEMAAVPPHESLTAQAITGALMMAVAQGDPAETTDRYRTFLAEGQRSNAEREGA